MSLTSADAGAQAGEHGSTVRDRDSAAPWLFAGSPPPSLVGCATARHLPLAGEGENGAEVSASERSDGVEGDPHQAFRDAEDRITVVQTSD